MKKAITQTVSKTKLAVLSVFMVVFCAFSLQAQNREMLLSENFDGNSMPSGWTIVGAGLTNWSISSTHNAGGEANEAMLSWEPQFNGTSRLTTPELDLTGVESVVVSFKHALDNYSGSHTIGIATSTDGSNWHSGWSQTFSSNGTWSVNQVISTEDFGSGNVKFCIYYTGNSYNINYWYFDNISIFVQEQLDISLNTIDVPSNIASGLLPVAFNVTNNGVDPITSLRVNYEIEGMGTISEDFTTNLSTFSSTTLTFEEGTFLSPGDYTLNVWISEVNGMANEGDELSKMVSVAAASVQRKVMIEHFSSSTCGPCVSVNTQMQTLTNNNPGKFCYVKYQMNWPGSGDPYYTAEGGVRRTYYGVDGVPYVVGEGGKYAANPAIPQVQFNQFYEEPAYIDIRGSFQIDGNTVNVKADIFPNITASGLTLFVVVNEKETHNNVGGNGETSFHHVMMKMLPNAQGTSLDLVAGETQSFEFSHDMTSTHVEEITDLEVAIFIQNLSSSEVFNSNFAYEYTDIHPYPVENLQIVKENSDLNISWNAHTMSEPTGYMIRVGGEVVEENYQGTSYTYENATEDFYAVQIEALYGEMSSVAVTKCYENEEGECLSITGLSGVQDAHDVVLTWATSATATGYEIYRDEVLIATIENVATYTDVDVEEGTHTYSVVSICPDGLTSEPVSVEVVVDFTDISELSNNVNIYPNPAADFIKIEGNNIEIIHIYNTLGQLVKSVTVNNNSFNMSISDLQQGIYIFDVKTSDAVIRSRVVISR